MWDSITVWEAHRDVVVGGCVTEAVCDRRAPVSQSCIVFAGCRGEVHACCSCMHCGAVHSPRCTAWSQSPGAISAAALCAACGVSLSVATGANGLCARVDTYGTHEPAALCPAVLAMVLCAQVSTGVDAPLWPCGGAKVPWPAHVATGAPEGFSSWRGCWLVAL